MAGTTTAGVATPAAANIVSSPTDVPKDTRGSDVAEGRALRDEGAGDAHAAVHHLTREAARRSIERRAAAGVVFGADDVFWDVEAEVGDLPISGSPNYLGGAFLAAKHAGIIAPAGVTTSRRRSRHAGLQRLWIGVEAEEAW
jgi:hypothetical protein